MTLEALAICRIGGVAATYLMSTDLTSRRMATSCASAVSVVSGDEAWCTASTSEGSVVAGAASAGR